MKKNKPDEYYNDGIIELAKCGDVISATNLMSEDQHAQFVKELADSYEDLVNEINEHVNRIRALVQKTDPSNLLNYIFSMNMMASMNKESEADYSAELNAQLRSIEYIQSVLVSSPNYYEEKFPVDETQFAEILRLTTDLFEKLTHFYFLWGIKAKSDNSLTDDELYYSIISQTMSLVRGNQYQCFRLDVINSLISPHQETVCQIYGINTSKLMEGLKTLERNLTSGRLDAFDRISDLINDVPDNIESVTEDYKAMAQEAFNQAVGIDLHDVKKHTNWPDKLIEDLSLGINSDGSFFSHDVFNGWPIWDLPIRLKPFIKINELSLCFDYYTLFDNFYRSLQSAIFSYGEKYKEKWKSTQTETSEQLVGDIFSRLLPGCIVHRSNYYNIPTGSAENDLIISYRDVLFVVEVKAGSYTYTPAFLDLKAHKESLKTIICKAEKQCIRTRDYILSCSEAKFFSDSSLKNYSFSINPTDYSQIYMLDITVDSINEIASSVEKIKIANAQEEIISISIDDLWVYSDFFDNPAQFIHFIKQRVAATRTVEINLFDELDHLGLYITNNMYALHAQTIGQGDKVHYSGCRKELDHYYACKQLGLKSNKPKQMIPEALERIIDIAIRKCSIKFPFQFANFLLDFSSDGRQAMSDLITRLIVCGRKSARLIPGMCFGEASYCLIVKTPEIRNYHFNIVDYVEANLLKSKRESCYLIELEMGDQDAIEDIDVRLFTSSNINPERLDILKAYGDEIVNNRIGMYSCQGIKVKIGRNEKCPCGSGKKYKNCCGR